MGTINNGQQLVSFDYNSAAHSDLINRTFHKTIPLGIKSGFTLSRASASEVTLTPGVLVVEDQTKGVSVRVQTQTNITVGVTPQTPYLVCRYQWVDSTGNYADFVALGYSSIVAGDVILGKAQFFEGTLLTTFDNNLRGKTVGGISALQVIATEPASNKVTVTGGKFWINKRFFSFTEATLSPAFPPTTDTAGRVDLLCIDKTGTLAVMEFTGEYPSLMFPIAKITRILSRGTVEHDDIEVLQADFSYFGGINGQFAVGNFPNLTDDLAFVVGNGTADNAKANALEIGYDGDMVIQRDVAIGRNLTVTGGEISSSANEVLLKQGTETIFKVTGSKTVIGDNASDTTGMRNHGLRVSATESATNPLFDLRNNGATVLEFQKDVVVAPTKLSLSAPRFRFGNQDTDALYENRKVAGQLTISHIDSSNTTPETGSIFCVQEKLPNLSTHRMIDLTSNQTGDKRWMLEFNNLLIKPNRSILDHSQLSHTEFMGEPINLKIDSIYKLLVPGIVIFYKWVKTSSGGYWKLYESSSFSNVQNVSGAYEITTIIAWERQNWFSYPVREGQYIRMTQTGITTSDLYFRFVPFGAPVNNAYVQECKTAYDGNTFATMGLQYTYDYEGQGEAGYIVSRGNATTTGKVVIPAKYGLIHVGAIAENGFANRTAMTRCMIPRSVLVIGAGAFDGCVSLLGDCDGLDIPLYDTNRILPEGVAVANAAVYRNCSSIAYFFVPTTLTRIEADAFNGCTSLNLARPDQDDSPFRNIVYVGNSAFSGCVQMAGMYKFPGTITYVGSSAFRNCSDIDEIALGDNTNPNSTALTIGAEAFYGCSGLARVILGMNTPPTLGTDAFKNCTSLNKIVVPAGKADIYKAADGWSAFASIISEVL